jgi:hypothetical protein
MTPTIRLVHTSLSTTRAFRPRRRLGGSSRRAMLVVAVALAALLAACGGPETFEVEGAAGVEAAAVPPPTYPGPPPGVDEAGGTPGAAGADIPEGVSDLIRRIDALSSEDDLCTLLTGEFAALAAADVNPASITSNPASMVELFASLDRLFDHMVQIAPYIMRPPLVTIQQLWRTAAEMDLQDLAAREELESLIQGPEVTLAQAQIAAWVPINCT